MKIANYLKEIEPAATVVINEIHREERNVASLTVKLEELKRITIEAYAQVDGIIRLDEELERIPGYIADDPGLATMLYWDAYFGVDKDRHHAEIEVDEARLRLSAHEFAKSALSGSLLQFAKQGLSLRYGKKLSDCYKGRPIGSQTITDVIWCDRNQALHWEDGEFKEPTKGVMVLLANDLGSPFDQYATCSLAYEIVSYLNWNTFNDFANDLLALDP